MGSDKNTVLQTKGVRHDQINYKSCFSLEELKKTIVLSVGLERRILWRLLVTKKIIILIRDHGEEYRVIRALRLFLTLTLAPPQIWKSCLTCNLVVYSRLIYFANHKRQAKRQHGVILTGKIVKRSKSNKPSSLCHFLAEKR